MKKKRKRLIKYINDHIDDCLISDRAVILNMIAQKQDTDNLYEEGTGIRILFSKISDRLLEDIKEFIIEAKKKTYLKLSDSD